METKVPQQTAGERHVFLPVLRLSDLAVLRYSFGSGTRIHYSQLPLYARALTVLNLVSEPDLARAAAWLTQTTITRAVRDGSSFTAPAISIATMNLIVPIVEALETRLTATRWFQTLADLIGPEFALAYCFRRLSWHEIWPPMIGLAACREQLESAQPLLVAWDADWPREWRDCVEQHLSRADITFWDWPRWYLVVHRRLAGLWWAAAATGLVVCRLARQGLTIARRRPEFSVAIEFVDGDRMGGTEVDTNFVEDQARLDRSKILLFLTPEQHRVLKRHGRSAPREVQRLRAAGFTIARTDSLSFRWHTIKAVGHTALRLWPSTLSSDAACLGPVFYRACADYLTYAVLFDNFDVANILHSQNYNGIAGVRLDSAIVTALCRQRGVRSVGFQNRCIYERVYEDSFNCYDVYLTWGPRWISAIGSGGRFLGQPISVGCLHNAGLAHTSRRQPMGKRPLTVTVFTSEFGGNHYPRSSTINLVLGCLKLAALHPTVQFRMKTKDPQMVDALLADAAIAQAVGKAGGNFAWLKLNRHVCAPLIEESDIVIASGFTTPGSDALLLGKRVVFYSELASRSMVFDGFRDLVAGSTEELERLFAIALTDYGSYAEEHLEVLKQLDPYRDGNVHDRFLAVLTAPRTSQAVSRDSRHKDRVVAHA